MKLLIRIELAIGTFGAAAAATGYALAFKPLEYLAVLSAVSGLSIRLAQVLDRGSAQGSCGGS